MNPLAILALDPGKAGGLAWTMDNTARSYDALITGSCPMPDTQGGVLSAIRVFAKSALELNHPAVAYLEQVGGMMRVGKKNAAAAHTMFTFGENYGFLKGVLQTLGIRLVMVHPKKWQKHFSLGAKKDCASPGAWKAKLQAEAQRRYPDYIVTRSTADALLILDYAKAQESRLI